MSQGIELNRHVIDFRQPGDNRSLDEMNISHFAADAIICNFASLSAWLERISGRVPPAVDRSKLPVLQTGPASTVCGD